MKFGERLKKLTVPEWKAYYLNYDRCKDLLKIRADKTDLSDTHRAFFEFFEKEVDKIELFYITQLKMYSQKLDSIQLQFYRELNKKKQECQETLKKMSEQLNYLSQDVLLFQKYIQVNRTAVRKILKKHDKQTKVDTKDSVLDVLRSERLWFSCEGLRDLCEDTEKTLSEVCRQVVRRYFVS